MTEDDLTAGVSIIVPVYRGAATLPELYRRLNSVLETNETPFEILLVDDGSSSKD